MARGTATAGLFTKAFHGAVARVRDAFSDADEAGAAWAVGAAARMPWSDEDDHSSTAESGSESSAGEETPVVERPPAPRAPFGVRLANRGAALVHVHGSRDVVSAYACGAQVSNDFWAACASSASSLVAARSQNSHAGREVAARPTRAVRRRTRLQNSPGPAPARWIELL